MRQLKALSIEAKDDRDHHPYYKSCETILKLKNRLNNMMAPGNITKDQAFDILEEIGKGGMGTVLRVNNRQTGEIVALKYCQEKDQESLHRFSREVRFMARIDHENVMPILTQNLEHTPPYFTMPLAQGSLHEEARKGLPEESVLELFKQICLGVQAIHSANGTHRDIKPVNALLMSDGRVVVSDLGLIKTDPRDSTVLTQTNVTVGTFAYCAPEQQMPGGSRDADSRTDVYQLGKTLYELLTGDFPILIDPAKVSSGLAYVIGRAVRPNSADRYQSVGALMDAIQDYQRAQTSTEPSISFDAALEKVDTLAQQQNQYREEDLVSLINSLLAFAGQGEAFIDNFGKLPDQLLIILAEITPEALQTVLKEYYEAIKTDIHKYNFGHAQTIAHEMSIVFQASKDAESKAKAIRPALIAAAFLHRFTAMDTVAAMLTSISDEEVAIAVAEVLREELDSYRPIAKRISANELHPVLKHIHDSLMRKDKS